MSSYSVFFGALTLVLLPSTLVAQNASHNQLMAELQDLQVPAAVVWKAEKFFIEQYKKHNKGIAMPADERAKLRRTIAEKQIEMGLIEKFVRENGLQVDPQYAEQRFETMKRSLQEQGVPLELHYARFGKDEASFRRFNTALLALELKLSGEIGSDELAKAYEQEKPYLHTRRARQILIQFDGARMNKSTRSKEDAWRRAELALQKMRDGASFDEVVKAYSDAPVQEGTLPGDLGYLAQAHVIDPQTGRPLKDRRTGLSLNHVIDPPLTKALFALDQPGKLSEIVESDFGFHILQLTELKQFEDFKDYLHQQLLGIKMSKFINQLNRQNEVHLRLNEKLIDQTPPDELP